ncbi:1062_t:CDS:2 [Entrophospora sp. SA101]|nr:1062_t:CDS:2 [Entrophospora sp. SA101]
MDDLIAEIKDYEDTDDLLTAKRIEDTKRLVEHKRAVGFADTGQILASILPS